MLTWLRNELDFAIRRSLRLRRPGCRLPAESKEGLYTGATAAEAERLVAAYNLHRWKAEAGRTDFAASLFYLHMLERALREARVQLPSTVRALDAGCGDWFYVRALFGLLSRYEAASPRSVSLTGVEVDAYQPYAGFRARIDWAEAFAEGLEGARYLPGDAREVAEQFDLVFLLFPFLFAADLGRWGLPRRYLRPQEYLSHLSTRVRPGGWLVIANLGEEECTEQHRLLAECDLRPLWWSRHESPLFRYKQPRYVTVIERA